MPPPLVREVRGFADDVESRLDSGDGLWFMGDVGTGKTTLAMLVSRTALAAGRGVAIYSLPRLIGLIRRTYDEGSALSDADLIEQLVTVDLLHIDDLGAERTSDWVLEQLYSIINGRYEEQRSIVLTTNIKDPGELERQVGQRTVSRLTEMCQQVPVFGADRRMVVR
jgi:DNA replication protein DnaC